MRKTFRGLNVEVWNAEEKVVLLSRQTRNGKTLKYKGVSQGKRVSFITMITRVEYSRLFVKYKSSTGGVQ